MSERGHGARALAAVLARITRPLFARRGFADGAILNHWEAIVGKPLAAATSPEKIVYARGERRDGVLHLRIANGALATEMQHLEPQLLERVNTYFGYRAVGRLRLVHGPLPVKRTPDNPSPRALDDKEEADLDRRLAGVTDPDLRAALESLGRAAIGRRRSSDPA